MFCKNCGNQLDDNAVICVKCGCLIDEGVVIQKKQAEQQTEQQVETPKKVQSKTSANETLGLVAKILMIISCVFTGFYLIPLCWTIPMTVSLSKKLKNKEDISVAFKICILLFVNTISGILLLCMKDEK